MQVVSIPQAVSTVATYNGEDDYMDVVSIPQAVSTVATCPSGLVPILILFSLVSIPQAVSTVATWYLL